MSAPAHAPVPHRGMVSFAVMAATMMQVLDTTIVNVALPHMQGSLSATSEQISWVLTSYIVAAAVMTPPTGWLAGRFGRKRVFLVSVAAFTTASVLCGLSRSLEQMVVFRLLQGVFGASLAPLAQSSMLDAYPREKHGSAMAMFGMGIMVGPILGPSLGGYLTETYDWRWVFYINVPVGILTLVLLSIYLPDGARVRRPFDGFGFAMLSLGVGALQMLLDRGQGLDWFESPEIVFEAMLVCAGFYLFTAHAATARGPVFIDLSLLKDRNLVTGLTFIFVVGGILMSTMALVPPFLQGLLGYPVLETGNLLAPRGMGTMAGMIILGRLGNRGDPRVFLLLGLGLTALTLWIMTGFSLDVSTTTILWTGVLQGFGFGLIFVPLTLITFATLAPQHRTEAAGLYALMRNLGGSIGISTVITLLTRGVQTRHAALAEHISPYNPLLHTGIARSWNLQSGPALAQLNGEVTRQAAMLAYLDDFQAMLLVTLLAMPLVLLVKRPRRPEAPAAAAAAQPAPAAPPAPVAE